MITYIYIVAVLTFDWLCDSQALYITWMILSRDIIVSRYQTCCIPFFDITDRLNIQPRENKQPKENNNTPSSK